MRQKYLKLNRVSWLNQNLIENMKKLMLFFTLKNSSSGSTQNR